MATALVSLQGPLATEIFVHVFGPGFLDMVEHGRRSELLLGHHRVAVMRNSHVGEDGFWLLLNPDDGSEIWRSFLDAGAISAGIAAHDALRLESGVLEAPAETPAPRPLRQRDWARWSTSSTGTAASSVTESSPGRGRCARPAEPERRIAGLRLEGPRLARAGTRVVADGHDVGACVAAGYSPALGTGIAIAYLPPGLDRAELETDGERTPAAVVPLPFVPPR